MANRIELNRVDFAKAFITRATLASLLLGLAVHLRILVQAPVRSSEPMLWLLLATVQNLATMMMTATLATIIATRFPRTASTLFVIVTMLRAVLQAGLSEAVIFFGHGLFRENLQMALHPTLFAGSLRGATASAIILFVAAMALLLVFCAWSAWRHESRMSLAFMATMSIVSAAGANVLPPVQLAEATSNPVWTIVRLLRHDVIANVTGTMVIPSPAGPPDELRAAMPRRHSQIVDARFPLAYVPPPRSAAAPKLPLRPNIVFWVMEGFRAEEVGAYGGAIPNLTPNFDSLARQSVFFENAYSAGSFTPEGELALWYGLQADPYEIVIRTRPNAVLYGLPEMLAHDGYSLLWVHPSDAEMYLSTRFYLHRGFHVMDGRDFDPKLASTNWGYSDRALAETLVQNLDRMPQPFAAMGVTVSNHHPFQVPLDARTKIDLPSTQPKHGYINLDFGNFQAGEHTMPRMHTVHYSDEALGYFLELARKRDWFANTIFVIGGDHGTPTQPLGRSIANSHEFLELRHRVALLMYSPLLAPRVIKRPVSHVDMMPTILGLMGDERTRAGLGIDLLDPDERDDNRMLITYSDARALRIQDAHFSYDALLRREGDRYTIYSETMFSQSDKHGANEISAQHPAELARFHAVAVAYLDSYGWLVATGRTGVPANARERRPN